MSEARSADATRSDGTPDAGTVPTGATPGLRTAWQALPDRWHAVLRHTEVALRPSAEVAELLGTSARAVHPLARRAREGLRRALLQHHLRTAGSPRCTAAVEQLPALLDGSLTAARSTVLRRHLRSCAGCRAAADDLQAVRSDLPSVVRSVAGPDPAG